MRSAFLLLLVLSGCGGTVNPRGDGSVDGGSVDGGSVDGGSVLDAGMDAAPPDDGGPIDGGLAPSPANIGWIGGACAEASDCFDVTDPICLTDGYANGMCTQTCSGVCPDRGAVGDTVTFCIDGIPHGFPEGICASRCDPILLPPDGCPEGYRCVEHNRYADPAAVFSVCIPDLAPLCPGASDELVTLDYPDRGAVWIPSEAACRTSLDVLVLMHGLNAGSNPTPSLGGGRRLELLVRQLIDAGLIDPLILAEPVHFDGSSVTLYGAEFDPVEHLTRVQTILDARGVTMRTLSYVGHSGAGCNRNNGLYEVLDRYADLIGPFAPSMRLWGLMDTCYAGSYHYDVPIAVLGGQNVVIASMYTAGDSLSAIAAFEAGLLTAAIPLDCNATIYSQCLRDSVESWCSYRTRSLVVHNTNPYFFLREMLPQTFSPDPSVQPCR